jgi:protein ERP2
MMLAHFISILLFLLHLLLSVQGSALTTFIAANERLCFYADVDKAGEKIGVSFFSTRHQCIHLAVISCRSSILQYVHYIVAILLYLTLSSEQVQSGGSFDIDFEIKDPNQKVLLDGNRERQGDYVLTANTVGEYAFCFENDMSTLTEKLVDFDIMVESEPRREAPAKAGQIADHTSALEESVFRLNGMLLTIKRLQKQ